MKAFIKTNATLLALVLIMGVLSFISPEFFTTRNLSNLANQVTIIGIMSVGMTLVILIGGIDLSVGSILGLAAIVVTMLMQAGMPMPLAIVATLILCGGIIGLFNGFMIAKYRIPPFIITLGMMTIARGLALTLSGGGSVPVTSDAFSKIGNEFIPKGATIVIFALIAVFFIYSILRQRRQFKIYGVEMNRTEFYSRNAIGALAIAFFFYVFVSYQGIPGPVAIFTVIALFGAFLLTKTKLGRRMYALGGNEEAARLSGINVFRTKLFVYTAMASLASVSGIILSSRLGGASPNLGNMGELDAIASVVIGGTSLSGGTGTITGSIIGTFIIGVLNNGMSLLGINMFYQFIAKGAIIIIAVWFDVMSKNKAR